MDRMPKHQGKAQTQQPALQKRPALGHDGKLAMPSVDSDQLPKCFRTHCEAIKNFSSGMLRRKNH